MRLPVRRPRWQLSLMVETAAAPLPILDRMSGLPLGLPAACWPICEECGRPMAFIGQLANIAPPAPPAGRPVVYAFLCVNPETSLACHRWAVEPKLRRITHAVVAAPEPPALGAF